MKLEALLKEADVCRPETTPMITASLVPDISVRSYLTTLLQEKDFTLTEENMKRLHCLLCRDTNPEAAGRYKEDSEELNRYIQHYLGQLEISKRLYHPIEFAAIAHKRFLDISPFAQDNEEMAEILLNIWLVQGGYPEICLRDTNMDQYQGALEKAGNPECPDPDALVRFIAQNVVEKEKRNVK